MLDRRGGRATIRGARTILKSSGDGAVRGPRFLLASFDLSLRRRTLHLRSFDLCLALSAKLRHGATLADDDDLFLAREFSPHHPDAQLLPGEILNKLLILDCVSESRLSEKSEMMKALRESVVIFRQFVEGNVRSEDDLLEVFGILRLFPVG